jgi:iron complex transport system ATP-binding protein
MVYKVGTPKEVMTEETIRQVYGIDCKVIDYDDSPHVILKSAFDDEEESEPEVNIQEVEA